MFNIETMLSDDFSSILEDIGSKFSVRRYVLPLELDNKVDSVQFIPLNWRYKCFYNVNIGAGKFIRTESHDAGRNECSHLSTV